MPTYVDGKDATQRLLERQVREDEDERRHRRFMKIMAVLGLTVALSAVVVAAVTMVLIIVSGG